MLVLLPYISIRYILKKTVFRLWTSYNVVCLLYFQGTLLPMTHISFIYLTCFSIILVKVAYFWNRLKTQLQLGVHFCIFYIENSDCQVNMNVSRILYKIHFPILTSTKTMSNESLSSQYILQIMLPILRSATRLLCTIFYMFWLLSSLTVFKRTIDRILFLFIWLLFTLSWSCTVPIADFENKRFIMMMSMNEEGYNTHI